MHNNLKILKNLIFVAIVLFTLFGLFYCAFYVPFHAGLFSYIQNGTKMEMTRILGMVLNWGCSIPCFVVLIYVWKVARSIDVGGFFEEATVKNMITAGAILSIDCEFFTLANIALSCILRDCGLEVIYSFLRLVGMAIGGCMFFAARAVRASIFYKKEGEGII